jgi:type I restriction enzyme S subunit
MEMKKGWQIKKLADLVDVQNGYAFSSKDYSESGHFLMRIGNVQNGFISTADPKFIKLPADGSLQRFVLSEDDILVSLTGNVGRVGVIQESHLPAALNQRVARISIRKDSPATRDLLLFFLCSDWFREELIGAGHGAAQQNVSTKDLVEIEIPVPPLAEQQRIVGLLDEAFEGLATAKANAQKNLQNARALFESHLQSVFTQRGPGWVEKPLGEVADLLDCLHKTPTYAETGFPMVRVTDIKPGFLDLSKTRKVDEQTFIAFSKGRTPRAGDIVFSRVGSCGVSALVSSDEPFCLGQNTVFILPKMNSMLLYHFLNSPNAKEQFEGFIDGTTQPTISMKSIRQVTVPIAPPAEHGHLVASLDSMREETQRLARLYERKLAALEALKKSLLHQAFTGEL